MEKIIIKGSHEYDLKVENNIYYLYYSNKSFWFEHLRGKLALKIEDTGNGLILPKLPKLLDYSTAEKIFVILNKITYGK
jgi:hypothetical protein